MLGVALCYALSVLYAGRTVRGDRRRSQVSLGQLSVRPLLDGAVRRSRSCPPRRRRRRLARGVVALGVLGSGIAYLLYFAIIASAGASRAILVTYLVPAFALVYGARLPRRGR